MLPLFFSIRSQVSICSLHVLKTNLNRTWTYIRTFTLKQFHATWDFDKTFRWDDAYKREGKHIRSSWHIQYKLYILIQDFFLNTFYSLRSNL